MSDNLRSLISSGQEFLVAVAHGANITWVTRAKASYDANTLTATATGRTVKYHHTDAVDGRPAENNKVAEKDFHASIQQFRLEDREDNEGPLRRLRITTATLDSFDFVNEEHTLLVALDYGKPLTSEGTLPSSAQVLERTLMVRLANMIASQPTGHAKFQRPGDVVTWGTSANGRIFN